MIRKHFETIATTVRNSDIPDDSRQTIAKELAVTLSRTNNRFDRDKFIEACTR